MNSIGFFQFDNLVQGRVPFVLFSFGIKVSDDYQYLEKKHLEGVTHILSSSSTPHEVLQKALELNLNKEHPIVALCQDGQISALAVTALEAANFKNCYFLNGGYIDLQKQKAKLV
jgi:rhodanese-related sulfurtransferase